MRARVASAVKLTPDIVAFELAAIAGETFPAYEPGSHIDIRLPNGITRQYSLCCATPDGKGYRIAVKLEPASRGGSAWLHASADVGAVLEIGNPRNAFALDQGAGRHLLFAGGIGITPILSMAYELRRRKAQFHLHYFTRSRRDVAFEAELQGAELAGHVSVHCGRAPEAVSAAIATAVENAPPGSHAYACGPAGFMDAVRVHARERLGAHAIHTESFAAAPQDGDQPFMLRLQRSDLDIAVPADQSALASLQAAGVEIDCSCEVGVCGTCRTVVLEGQPLHRDSFLSDAERAAGDCFMPCVSRAAGARLVLDL
jgi:vanillate O-demethylase ferredoxin subunit